LTCKNFRPAGPGDADRTGPGQYAEAARYRFQTQRDPDGWPRRTLVIFGVSKREDADANERSCPRKSPGTVASEIPDQTAGQRPRTVRETDLYEMLAIIPARGHGRVSLPLVYPLNGTYSVPEYGGGLAAVTLRP
jgi:hypothetical protein